MSGGWREALARLAGQNGQGFWRGLDELTASPGFRDALANEFPALANGAIDWQRRDVLRAFGASLALAGLAGCEANPDDRALPYVESPEDLLPGVPRLYAPSSEGRRVGKACVRTGRTRGRPDHKKKT